MPRAPVCWGRACPGSLEGLGWGWTRIALAPYPEVTESRHLTPPLPSANTRTIIDAWISQRSPAATEVSPRAPVATSRCPLLAGFVRSWRLPASTSVTNWPVRADIRTIGGFGSTPVPRLSTAPAKLQRASKQLQSSVTDASDMYRLQGAPATK